MRKALLYIFLLGMGACTQDLTSLNQDMKNPTEVPGYTLFSNAEKELADIMTSTNVNENIFRLIAQYWTQTTYIDESQYNITTRGIPAGFWTPFYRDILKDLDEADSVIQVDGVVGDAAVIQNQRAVIETVKVYSYFVLVTTFGDIPYTQALNINNTTPAYDEATAVYSDLLTRINAAIGNMDQTVEGFGGADIIYSGDMAMWYKFANTLKLKMGMVLADSDPAAAQTAVEEAAPNVFTSNADNAVFPYLSAPPNTNPVWVDLVQSGRQDYVIASTVGDVMNTLSDPRRAFYFDAETVVGGTYGESNSYAAYTHASDLVIDPTWPGLLLDYSETEFFLAEAVERGYNVAGTAAEHYNNAVTASITYWGGTPAQAQTYLAQPAVAYATATGDYKQKIGTQQWLAYYNRGWDAWLEWRRLDYPALVAPADAVSEIPVRFTYPISEQNLNQGNYESASSAIGGDVVTTKLFWDMN